MASVDELQDELVRQSSARLEAEHERTRLEEQQRKLAREAQALRDEARALRDENAVLQQQVAEMQGEMADLSSSLVEEANVKVAEANRRVASAQRMVAERDTLLEVQASELQEIKSMMAQQEGAPARGPRRTRRPSRAGPLDADAILDLDAYASPVRPLLRLDTREFREFCEIFPAEGGARTFHFSLEALEAPAWRRSRFVQRLIAEDVEPALRLDRAAHMNWLTCRAFLAAVLDQTLVLEPVSAKERPWAHRPSHPCLLCGENREEVIYSRYFWARTTPEAEPLVLDLACLARVRLACELVGFIRSITDGKPGQTAAQQEQAWRECVSLREQLFWARTGGLYPEVADADAAPELAHAPASDLSRVGTPQLAQTAFAAASPANTLSSAVIEGAVPRRSAPDAASHAPHAPHAPHALHSPHAPHSPQAPAVPARHRDADSVNGSPDSSPRSPRSPRPGPSRAASGSISRHVSDVSEHSAHGAAASKAPNDYTTHATAATNTSNDATTSGATTAQAPNTAYGAATTKARHTTHAADTADSANTADHSIARGTAAAASHRSYTPTAAPARASTQDPAPTSARGSPTAQPPSPSSVSASPRAAQRDARDARRPAAEAEAETETDEFRFDDDEFHSPAGTPEPAPREAMPGGWPG